MTTFTTGIPLITRNIQPPLDSTRITINKTITGDLTDDQTFHVTIIGTDGETSWVIGSGVPISQNHPLVFNNIRYGTYTVTESAVLNYTNTSITPTTFTISASNPKQVVGIVNAFTHVPETIKYGALYNWYAIAKDPVIANYGLLYNWYAVTDVKNITSVGWHVSSKSNWDTLIDYLGGTNNEGGKLKELGFTNWNTPNTGATNIFGFNGKGCGVRNGFSGAFSGLKTDSRHLTSDAIGSQANVYTLSYTSTLLGKTSTYDIHGGSSIRLVKDSTTLSHGQTGTYTGNDGKVYRTICIGTQEYTVYNLCETKFRDGSGISEITSDAAWAALTTPALCAYNNDWSNVVYNTSSITRNGFDVPTRTQIIALYTYLGTVGFQDKMKDLNPAFWNDITGITNSMQFNMRGAGYRLETDGSFTGEHVNGHMWCIDGINASQLNFESGQHNASVTLNIDKKRGNSIRPIKTTPTAADLLKADGAACDPYFDGEYYYRTVKIGTQVWVADNIKTRYYADGTAIPVVTGASVPTTGAMFYYGDNITNA